MKCFIHYEAEAIAACRICGKGMCAKCSAYSSHTGICPECRKKEFVKERDRRERDNKELKWDIFKNAAATILLCWTIIGGIVFGIRWYNSRKTLESNMNRIEVLSKEIIKLDRALKNRGSDAFV